jgi:hypothetical protein
MTFFKGAPMAAGIQQPHAKNTAELKLAIQGLLSASRKTFPEECTADGYREGLIKAMTHLKATSIQALQVGHMDGIEVVSTLNDEINDMCMEDRGSGENEIFWDEMANHYPPLHPNHWIGKNLPGPLQIKLATCVLDQMAVPTYVPRQILEMMPNAHFMNALTMILQRLMPPYRRFNLNMQDALSLFAERLNDDGVRVNAVDYLLAHQELYFPLIKKLMSIAEPQPITSARDTKLVIERQERYERQLLGKLGYSAEEIEESYAVQQRQTLINIDYLVETGRSISQINEAKAKKAFLPGLPAPTELQLINKCLSWPAEFLVSLYEESQNPLFIDQAKVAFEYPAGNRPYLHFEKLGITKTPQWHQSTQEKSSPLKTAMLYEHAIHTDGIELAPAPISNKEFDLRGPPLNRMLMAIASAPLSNEKSVRKAQCLFDALITRANDLKKPEPWIIDAIKASAISPKYYRSHKKLIGDLLEDRLGL